MIVKMRILVDRAEGPCHPQQASGIQRSWYENYYFTTLSVFEETQMMIKLQSGKTEIQSYNIQKSFWMYFSVAGNNNQ